MYSEFGLTYHSYLQLTNDAYSPTHLYWEMQTSSADLDLLDVDIYAWIDVGVPKHRFLGAAESAKTLFVLATE